MWRDFPRGIEGTARRGSGVIVSGAMCVGRDWFGHGLVRITNEDQDERMDRGGLVRLFFGALCGRSCGAC
jgi:hypothetical protein